MIVTFYSYKGGTGRTMAMANIAGLLSSRGKKVLAIDFDLEAPGLWRYFSGFHEELQQQEGLIDLLLAASAAEDPLSVDWRDYVTEVPLQQSLLSLMTSGQLGNEYPSRVLNFDWTTFFRDSKGGEFIESMRTQWRQEYDFILIDSRTGITDAGGICTILLPDLIVPVFVSNRQSLEGVVEVITRAQAGRNELAYDRPPAIILPILSRFDSRTEWKSAQEWLDIAADRLGPFYADWLPRKIRLRNAIERTKLPYVAYFSFGETLPALAPDISDPDSLGYALNTISQLIESELGNVESIMGGISPAVKIDPIGRPRSGSSSTKFFDGSHRSDNSLRRVGLLGAPGSGKTTFLSALYAAISRSSEDVTIYGADDASTEFLVQNTSELVGEHRFPAATVGLRPLSWVMNLQIRVPQRRKFFRSAPSVVPLQLNIDLLDAPGEIFASTPNINAGGTFLSFDDDPTVAIDPENDVIDYLAGCDGLIICFDPARELRHGDAYEYLQGTLLRIAQRRFQTSGLSARLPHYVAVCITKFDDAAVYQRLRAGGYISYAEDDPYLFPCVRDEDAASFFADLSRDPKFGQADLVSATLAKYFAPERIHFFVTSAVGFYVGMDGRFNQEDFQNVIVEASGEVRIRGPIHPINVLVPLLWLGHHMA